MDSILALAAANLVSPIILSFVLGLVAGLARSDLSFPEAIAKGLSLYLLFAIGFKGGAGVAAHGVDARLVAALLSGVALSLFLPFIAFALLRFLTRVSVTDAAAVAGHYGSISIVTFVAASTLLTGRGIPAESYMVAVAAAMEAPAILSALWLAAKRGGGTEQVGAELWREILLNGSIVLLLGAFVIGWVTGEEGLAEIQSFIVEPFKGVLCLFLLDMGIVAGRGLRGSRGVLSAGTVAFGILMPLVGAALGLAAGLALGLSLGGVVLLMVLGASASYIAVPAAMRVALPEANPALSLTLALGVTFPFNLTLGIPFYMMAAAAVTGS
ncbi:sodium-dependent bicarbonate transport family permease [Chelativorans salis]|uniref:Sodium-dependent bicarbonate transport family permease n=1 Tax=Chelativorans salis TaxID=2978478 RepID=A0ABT2LJR3_9HYPH|nr:sodium-dependent bicarbonate transport family permease [Chelativorans sp. EGI FJ00035]MCT7374841.1 sodium-dependent bicarbonate transport family permease [Chelativorans sp. EGI FJ00035]